MKQTVVYSLSVAKISRPHSPSPIGNHSFPVRNKDICWVSYHTHVSVCMSLWNSSITRICNFNCLHKSPQRICELVYWGPVCFAVCYLGQPLPFILICDVFFFFVFFFFVCVCVSRASSGIMCSGRSPYGDL